MAFWFRGCIYDAWKWPIRPWDLRNKFLPSLKKNYEVQQLCEMLHGCCKPHSLSTTSRTSPTGLFHRAHGGNSVGCVSSSHTAVIPYAVFQSSLKVVIDSTRSVRCTLPSLSFLSFSYFKTESYMEPHNACLCSYTDSPCYYDQFNLWV